MGDDIVLSFGKYRGMLLCKVPSGYLKWMAEEFENEEWCCKADEEYRRRTDDNEHIWED